METQDRKTKNTIKILTIVGIVLILALIAAIVYFFVLKDDDGGEEEDLSKKTCGCYLIDHAVINACGDPRRGFSFNLNTVNVDQMCQAKCDGNEIDYNLLNTTTPKDTFESCPLSNISDTRCETMILKDQNDKIITGKIKPGDEINAVATFDKSTYTNYIFVINSEDTLPDSVVENVITKKITPAQGKDSIDIKATATDARGETIDSGITCRRIVDIEGATGSAVTNMTALTEQQPDGKTKISRISISVGQINSSNIKIRFTFEPEFTTLEVVDGITVDSLKGTLELSKLELYEPSNFTEESFNVLNNHLGSLKIMAEVFVNENMIGQTETTVTFSDSATPPPTEEEPIADEDKSQFTVTKAVEQSCIERVDGMDSATYTITVNNGKTTPDSLTSIKDKLPLGFVYVVNSSILNGTATPDSGLVTVNQIGDSQEIVWQPTTPWSIAAGGTMTLLFEAKATPTAITGQNLNEVILNPVEIPLDPSTLRTQVYVVVAQDCENPTEEETEIPQTGIFDNFITRILLGVFLLGIGWIVYTRPAGNILSENILKSKIYDEYELTKYKIINPKKYFEEKILRKKSKGR